MHAKRDSWKTEDFAVVRKIPFTASYSLEDFELIRRGFVPAQMEDKWFAYYDEPELFFHRSWTGYAVYRVGFSVDANRVHAVNAVCAEDVCTKLGPEHSAEVLEVLIGNLLLGQSNSLPTRPTSEPVPSYLEHGARPPWWKFWQ